MSDTDPDDIELEEGQTWKWDLDDGEIMVPRAEVTIEELFTEDGTPKVTFTESDAGLYDDSPTTVRRATLKQSLAEHYVRGS